MDETGEGQYFVYGVGTGSTPVAFIGCSEKRSDREIPFEVAERGSASLSCGVENVGQSNQADIFEIETFSYKREAMEAVDFWQRYFSFLGFNVSSARET